MGMERCAANACSPREVTNNKRNYTNLHLLMPRLELPANHGSMMNTQRKVAEPWTPRANAGLSCSRNPLRNQWTVCFSRSWLADDGWYRCWLLLPMLDRQLDCCCCCCCWDEWWRRWWCRCLFWWCPPAPVDSDDWPDVVRLPVIICCVHFSRASVESNWN